MSGLMCATECLDCFRYEQDENPACDIVDHSEGQKWSNTLLLGEIIIVRKGAISLSYDHFLNHRFVQDKILLLPPGCHFQAMAERESILFVFRIIHSPTLYENYPLKQLNEELKGITVSNQIHTLDVIEPIVNLLNALDYNINNGLRCSYFLQQKVNELILLLRAYYPKEELINFFRPILLNSSRFTNFVLQNYRCVKTVKELASLYACSMSNFDKKFRKAFGMAPYQWIQERKVKTIYHELYMSDKPLKQISEEQGFKSLPQFNDYCKKHLGYPPGKMRKIAPSMMSIKI